MAVWADVITEAKNRDLIRKSLDAFVCIAETSVEVPATITDVAGTGLVVPPDFKHLGWHTGDGLQWAREAENSEIESHGSVDPTRSDVRRVTSTLEVTAQETNIFTLGESLGLKLNPTLTTKELVIDELTRPKSRYFRTLAVSVDDTEFGEIYTGKLYCLSKVDSSTPGAWTDDDNAQSYGFTIKAFQDPDEGVAVRHFCAGPGFLGLAADMGFTLPAA